MRAPYTKSRAGARFSVMAAPARAIGEPSETHRCGGRRFAPAFPMPTGGVSDRRLGRVDAVKRNPPTRTGTNAVAGDNSSPRNVTSEATYPRQSTRPRPRLTTSARCTRQQCAVSTPGHAGRDRTSPNQATPRSEQRQPANICAPPTPANAWSKNAKPLRDGQTAWRPSYSRSPRSMGCTFSGKAHSINLPLPQEAGRKEAVLF